jgi:hypothetical protein
MMRAAVTPLGRGRAAPAPGPTPPCGLAPPPLSRTWERGNADHGRRISPAAAAPPPLADAGEEERGPLPCDVAAPPRSGTARARAGHGERRGPARRSCDPHSRTLGDTIPTRRGKSALVVTAPGQRHRRTSGASVRDPQQRSLLERNRDQSAPGRRPASVALMLSQATSSGMPARAPGKAMPGCWPDGALSGAAAGVWPSPSSSPQQFYDAAPLMPYRPVLIRMDGKSVTIQEGNYTACHSW